MFLPLQVYRTGIVPPSVKAELLSVKTAGAAEVGGNVAVAAGSKVGDAGFSTAICVGAGGCVGCGIGVGGGG
jgi:hypothetical protein